MRVVFPLVSSLPKNIPISFSLLHELEYRNQCRQGDKRGRHRSCSEYQKKTITREVGRPRASIQMYHSAVDV
jgi:hypothetical protein